MGLRTKSVRYPLIGPGERVKVPYKTHDYKMACCDCCLVHKMTFSIEGKYLIIRAWRHKKDTSILRKKNGITVRHG